MVLLLGRKQSSCRRCGCEPHESRSCRWSSGSRSGESSRETHAGPPGRLATDNFFLSGRSRGEAAARTGPRLCPRGRGSTGANGSRARRHGWARGGTRRWGLLACGWAAAGGCSPRSWAQPARCLEGGSFVRAIRVSTCRRGAVQPSAVTRVPPPRPHRPLLCGMGLGREPPVPSLPRRMLRPLPPLPSSLSAPARPPLSVRSGGHNGHYRPPAPAPWRIALA